MAPGQAGACSIPTPRSRGPRLSTATHHGCMGDGSRFPPGSSEGSTGRSAHPPRERPWPRRNTFPPTNDHQHLHWSRRTRGLPVRRHLGAFHQPRHLGAISSALAPASSPPPRWALARGRHGAAHVSAGASPVRPMGRRASQASALLFWSPTKLQGNVRGKKKRYLKFSATFSRVGIIHQNARDDSRWSSSTCRTSTAHPNPETAVTPHVRLNEHPEKAHASPKIKGL